MNGVSLAADDLRRFERAHVKAWPALETATIDGWLWRYSGGASQRANSVSTLSFTGSDPAAALDAVEARYRAKGVPARFHTFDVSAPADVTALLDARGYGDGETTITMAKPVNGTGATAEVEVTDHAGAEWREVYLAAITESRRAINSRILDAIPGPRAFFACRRAGRVVATALSVVDDGCAVVECVASREDARRQGAALAVLTALEAWAADQGARSLALQVSATNPAALALYRQLGFMPAATNRFRVRELS